MQSAADKLAIVHGTGSGPDHVRLERVLALKDAAWCFNRVRRPSLGDFPGADANVPLLQVGRCFFSGSLLATLALEKLFPEPSLFPNGNRGMPLALAWWSEAVFSAGCEQGDNTALRRHCALFGRQLADGRAFLQGQSPGLADVHAFAPLCALQQLGHALNSVTQDAVLGPWFKRVGQIGASPPSQVAIAPADLLLQHDRAIDPDGFPECEALAEKERLDWFGKPLYLWRSPFAA